MSGRPWRIERLSPYAVWVPTRHSFSSEARAQAALGRLLPSRPELSPRTFGANPRMRIVCVSNSQEGA